MGSREVPVRLSQAYLEMARAFFNSNLHWEPCDHEAPQSQLPDPYYTMNLAVASIPVIYSYLAVEAFVNFQLFKIWEHSREVHQSFELHEKAGQPLHAIPLLGEFYSQYGCFDDFEGMVKANMPKLKDRINVVCDAQEIPRIGEADKNLWDQFLDLVETTRHKLVHPNPEIIFLGQSSKRMFSPDSFEKYPEYAAQIIGYFYKAWKMPLPEYLTRNSLFKLPIVDLTFDPQIDS